MKPEKETDLARVPYRPWIWAPAAAAVTVLAAVGCLWSIPGLPRSLPAILTGFAILLAALSALALRLAQTVRRRTSESEAVRRESQRELAARGSALEALRTEHAGLESSFREKASELDQLRQDLQAEIAERKRVEEILRSSEQRYREAFDSANDLIYVHDLAGHFLFINQAVHRITGYTAAEALKMNIAQLLGPDGLGSVRTFIAQKLGGEGKAAHELAIQTKDGRWLTLEASSRLVYEKGVPVAVEGVARDITERKRLEAELLQSQKMEAIGRFAGGVAHDFNNLLTVIGAYGQMIGDALPGNEQIRGYTQEILLAAQRAGALTNRLLAFSRRQVFHLRAVDLNALILTMDNMLRRLIGEDIELRIELEPSLEPILADPGQIEQVVMNLAVNARDAMGTGGVLTLKTASAKLGENFSDAPPALPPGTYVMLEVTDTGVGMDAATQTRIFEPFFTTKDPGKGTGLGLSTVYGIVKQCAGSILVRSEPGRGATFTLYFPRAAYGQTPLPDLTPAAVPVSRTGETVLLVEDEPGVLKLVREMLLKQGYSVLEAASGEEALRVSEKCQRFPDILLSDIVMPNMSGCELAGRLRALHPELKVLYMSGYTEDSVLGKISPGPGVGLLKKPFLSDRLAQMLRQVLDDGNG
jgi:PAS domain S-box-containing protein